MSKRIAVGIGNTSVQFAQFDQDDFATVDGIPAPEWHQSVPCDTDLAERAWADSPAMNSDWIVASVNREAATRVRAWVESNWEPASYVSLWRSDFPVELAIESPDRVGRDRIAAAVAVNRLRVKDRSAIFADAGTAMTINALDRRGVFVGGAIFPGTLIASRALNEWTDQLPRVSVDWRSEKKAPSPIGTSTEAALESGLFWSAIGAVRELVRHMADELGDEPPLYVTGGFGEHLAQQLEGAIQIPHLVVAGIALSTKQARR